MNMQTPQTPSDDGDTHAHAQHNVDPQSYLRPQMKATGSNNRTLGTLSSIERHADSGEVTAIIVQHGLLRRKNTRVTAKRVKNVNQDSVRLDFSAKSFRQYARSAED
jgi:hypothetical protein